MFICIVRLNLVVEIGVPDTVATTESELKKFEYLEPLLKKNKLMPNKIASTNAIFDLPFIKSGEGEFKTNYEKGPFTDYQKKMRKNLLILLINKSTI